MDAVFQYQKPEKVREIEGFEGRYLVSDQGKVYSVHADGQKYEIALLRNGTYVNLSEKGRLYKVKVAYVVARAFVPNVCMRPFVVHKNGDTSDNAADNLMWSETREWVSKKKEGAQNKERAVIGMRKSGDELLSFRSLSEAAKVTGTDRSSIQRCCIGALKSAGGYIWRFKN